MKQYTKPEVTNITEDRGRVFPAIGLALAGGYVLGAAAAALGRTFGKGITEINISVPESVTA